MINDDNRVYITNCCRHWGRNPKCSNSSALFPHRQLTRPRSPPTGGAAEGRRACHGGSVKWSNKRCAE